MNPDELQDYYGSDGEVLIDEDKEDLSKENKRKDLIEKYGTDSPFFYNEQQYPCNEAENIGDSIPCEQPQPTVAQCEHEWVNVGFSTIKYACKKCNVDKPIETENSKKEEKDNGSYYSGYPTLILP